MTTTIERPANLRITLLRRTDRGWTANVSLGGRTIPVVRDGLLWRLDRPGAIRELRAGVKLALQEQVRRAERRENGRAV